MPQQFEIRFLPDDIRVHCQAGASLYDVARVCDAMPNAFCGGNGTCGKCMVSVTVDGVTTTRKACATHVDSDMTVTVPRTGSANILSVGTGRTVPFAPLVETRQIRLEKPAIGEERSEWELFCAAAGLSAAAQPPLSLVTRLNGLRDKAENGVVYASFLGGEPIAVEAAPTPHPLAAFDIGTTTIVCYLLDGETGRQLSVSSMLNPQTAFGADVISRARYALEHGGSDLQSAVVGALNKLLADACKKAGAIPADILLCSVVGNTCMHHLLLGLSPASLVLAPYNPAIRQALRVPAAALGLSIHPEGRMILPPDIAGFVGADTVGCLMATDFQHLPGTTLLIDIGTNGELALGNERGRIACSTAAGPAFEGAMIQCGMRGAAGAIDHVKLENGALTYSVIGGGKAAGICGSGLVDLIACLLAAGTLDESGRFDRDGAFAAQIVPFEGKDAFLLVSERDGADGKPVVLTQKDVRELQLAKAAMAAGIRLMSEALGVTVESIDRVLIAGAFGNYLDAHSACAIGLLPAALEGRIQGVGNAAGEGAKLCALSAAEYEGSAALAAETRFLELATRPDFQDCFVDELGFPEKEAL